MNHFWIDASRDLVMSDNLSVFEAQIAAGKIKCSDFTSAKWVLPGGGRKALQEDPVSPRPRPREKAALRPPARSGML